MRRFLFLVPVAAVALAVAACGPTNDKPSGPAPTPPPPVVDNTPKSPGQVVYENQGCMRCHGSPWVALMPNPPAGGPPMPPGGGPPMPPGGGGPPMPPMPPGGGPPMPPSGGPAGPAGYGKGPNLAKVGAKHDKEWIAAYIRDPKPEDKKESAMPKYGEDKLSKDDLDKLAEYLSGLK